MKARQLLFGKEKATILLALFLLELAVTTALGSPRASPP